MRYFHFGGGGMGRVVGAKGELSRHILLLQLYVPCFEHLPRGKSTGCCRQCVHSLHLPRVDNLPSNVFLFRRFSVGPINEDNHDLDVSSNIEPSK